MKKQKIIFLTPHLSTGGAPQYLLKKILELIDVADVYCIEYSNITGGVLVVQRSQIESLLGDRLITLNDNKYELINYIDKIQPDVIHLEELPEYFCDFNLSNALYSKNRKYKIIETSHDSSFNVQNKKFFPDAFAFVSEYQLRMFKPLNIPSYVVEYPITYKTKTDRNKALLDLGLNPNLKHFLNVGLFTSRKNQAEIIEYAKKLTEYPVQFHFVGNQADNFKSYWEPLMKNFPSNCKWWGERKDVDTFYNAMDAFLFTSRGTANDKETSPLVIREAIGWNLPLLMYNLPVYCGMYNVYKNITWLSQDLNKNLDFIKNFSPNVENSTKNHVEVESKLDVNIWFEKPNKILIGNETKFNGLVCIKDNITKIPMYFSKADYTDYNLYYFIPNGHLDFSNESYFSEFLIEFYTHDRKLIDSKTLKVREIDYVPITFNKNFSPFDCLYINYKQMFYDDIYSDLDLSNLDTVIDIGANVGLFSLYMLRKDCKKIYSIEPTIKAFSQLQNSMKDEKNVSVHKLAIHNFCGKSKIKSVEDNSTISGFIDEVHPYTHSNMNEEEVDVVTLKEFIINEKIEHIDLIKIDIEGVEYDVIDSLNDEIILISDRYLIEYHWAKNNNIKLKNIISRFKKLGYNIINKDDPNFENDLGFFFAIK